MPSRREFIQAGLAASVAPVAFPIRGSARPAPHVGVVTAPPYLLYCVVCDVRVRWSADLGCEAERLGVRVERTRGDITDLWFNDLSVRWKKAPVAIAGLTNHGPLFCLERLGWDHGLRVVLRGTHRVFGERHVEHVLAGPFRTLAAAHSGLRGPDWPLHLARLLNSCAASGETASTTVRAALSSGQERDVDGALFSWVIAPKPA